MSLIGWGWRTLGKTECLVEDLIGKPSLKPDKNLVLANIDKSQDIYVQTKPL